MEWPTFEPAQCPVNGLQPGGQYDGLVYLVRRNGPRHGFVSVCAFHLNDRCQEFVKDFGLGPGWQRAPGKAGGPHFSALSPHFVVGGAFNSPEAVAEVP